MFSIPIEHYEDRAISEALLARGVGSDELKSFLTSVRVAMSARGFPTAPITLLAPRVEFDDDCAAIAKINICMPVEGLGDLEEQLFDELIEQQDRIFCEGVVACTLTMQMAESE